LRRCPIGHDLRKIRAVAHLRTGRQQGRRPDLCGEQRMARRGAQHLDGNDNRRLVEEL